MRLVGSSGKHFAHQGQDLHWCGQHHSTWGKCRATSCAHWIQKELLGAWSGDGGLRGWLALDSSCHLHRYQLHLVVAEATMVGCLSWNWIMFRQLVVLGLLFGCLVTMLSIRGPVGVSTTSWMLGAFRQITFKTSTSKPVVHCVGSLASLTFRVTFFLNRDLRWHVCPSQGVDSYAGLCILDEGEGFQNVEPRCNYSLDSTSNVALKLKRKLPVSVSPRMEKGRPPPWTVYVSVFRSQSQPMLASWKKQIFNEQSSRPPLHGAYYKWGYASCVWCWECNPICWRILHGFGRQRSASVRNEATTTLHTRDSCDQLLAMQ